MNIIDLFKNTPEGILQQERQGQVAITQKSLLPREINGVTRKQLEAIGFKFGKDIDDVLVECELPPGWTKVAADHSMWSDLLDEQGRKRASIFYKAASYDRKASMTMNRRFGVNCFLASQHPGNYRAAVTDCGVEVHFLGESGTADYAHRDIYEMRGAEWLKENYPNHNDFFAYWS